MRETAGLRRRSEPVTLGVPIPIGSTHDDHLVMVDELGAPFPCKPRRYAAGQTIAFNGFCVIGRLIWSLMNVR